MNLTNAVVAICSLLFFMIGADKFLSFLEPPCSMETSISPIVWKGLGMFQLVAGILLWIPKYRKPIASFFAGFMFFFTIVHLFNNTYDIGGAASMAVLLGLLVWNPGFMGDKTVVKN